MNRYKTICLGIFVALIIFIFHSIESRSLFQQRDLYIEQSRFKQVIYPAIKDIYYETGRLPSSLDNFENTLYYPYTNTYTKTLEYYRNGKDTGCVNYSIRQFNNEEVLLRWVVKDENSSHTVTQNIRLLSPVDETQRRVKFYSVGLDIQIQFANKIREGFCIHNKSLRFLFRSTIRDRIAKPQLPSDIPSNQIELQRYLLWLKRLEGDGSLNDSWKHQIQFTISRHEFICRSSGIDGKFGTNDDIVSTRIIGK